MKSDTPRRLPVLMYHKVAVAEPDGLTVTPAAFEEQIAWLDEKGYTSCTFLDLKRSLDSGVPLPEKPIVITFDDAYGNFLIHALPLLKKYGMKATLFVPVAYIGKTNIWDRGNEKILSAGELKEAIDGGSVEIGIHSFLHRNYAEMAPEDMREDIQNCFDIMDFHHIPTSRVLAYPYGGFPKKDRELNAKMKDIFSGMQLWFALRIGNMINRLPVKDRYEMKRIDIRGTDSFTTFRIKTTLGRINPFA